MLMPADSCAASPSTSLRLGCGWMLDPISQTEALRKLAIAASARAAHDLAFGEYLVGRQYFDLAVKHYQNHLARGGSSVLNQTQVQVGLAVAKGGYASALGEKGNRELAEKLKTARAWGTGVYDGQQVHQTHVLSDKDVIELHF